jgi:hypothetical protein
MFDEILETQLKSEDKVEDKLLYIEQVLQLINFNLMFVNSLE